MCYLSLLTVNLQPEKTIIQFSYFSGRNEAYLLDSES